MDFNEVYQAVTEEFDERVATCTVVALTICLVVKVRDRDIKTPGLFTSKIDRKTKQVLHEYSTEAVDLAIKIRDVWPSYKARLVLHDLGGCRVRTIKELLNDS